MASVTLRDVWKLYGRVEAVKGLNIEVRDKEFLCLLGPSGCGKSSTLRMLAGLEEISRGEVFIGERVVNELEPRDRDVAMVFESYALYPHKTVYQNMAYPLRIRKTPASEVEERVRRAAKILEIDDLLDRLPRQLSGGQKQRVAVGRAIVREPRVFLMDEPISHLDAKLRAHMRGELKHLQRVLETTMIYVTHDQLEAISMADRIAIMDRGVLQQLGTPDEIFRQPANEFVAGFVGDPPMNFIDCDVEQQADRQVVRNQYLRLSLSSEQVARLGDKAVRKAEESLRLGIRPENITISAKPEDEESIRGEVYISELIGDALIVTVTVGPEKMRVKTDAGFRAEMGETVWLTADKSRLHLFNRETTRAYF